MTRGLGCRRVRLGRHPGDPQMTPEAQPPIRVEEPRGGDMSVDLDEGQPRREHMRSDAARFEHAVDLIDGGIVVENVLEDLVADDRVDALVGVREAVRMLSYLRQPPHSTSAFVESLSGNRRSQPRAWKPAASRLLTSSPLPQPKSRTELWRLSSWPKERRICR